MNGKQLRHYWCYKYESAFNSPYTSSKFPLEIRLLSRLLQRYNEYVVLEAIDEFLLEKNKKISSISFFGTSRIFDSKFEHIIYLTPIMKYKRLLLSFPQQIRPSIKALIDEYTDYIGASMLSDSEKLRKIKIIDELNELEKSSL